MSQTFKRTIENFTCEQCGQQVIGNGYTNHCPNCLYSKHVDIYPGDRGAVCGGMMKPVRIEMKGQEWFLLQLCLTCGFERKNKVVSEDNRNALFKLASG